MCFVTKLGFKHRFVPVPLLVNINPRPPAMVMAVDWQYFFAVGTQLTWTLLINLLMKLTIIAVFSTQILRCMHYLTMNPIQHAWILTFPFL